MEDIFLLFWCAYFSRTFGLNISWTLVSIHCVVRTDRLAEMMYASVMGSRLGTDWAGLGLDISLDLLLRGQVSLSI